MLYFNPCRTKQKMHHWLYIHLLLFVGKLCEKNHDELLIYLNLIIERENLYF